MEDTTSDYTDAQGVRVTERAALVTGVATIRYMPAEGGAPASALYERIRTEIALRGWTWRELCERTGLARSTFNSWKTQPQPPQARAVNAVELMH
jgi:hypothetical protein